MIRFSFPTTFLFLCLVSPAAAQLGGEPTGDSMQAMATAGADLLGNSVLNTAKNPAILPFVLPVGGHDWQIDSALRLLDTNARISALDGGMYSLDDTLVAAPWLAIGHRVDDSLWFSFAVVPTSGAKGSYEREVDLNIMFDDPEQTGSGPATRHTYEHSVEIQQVALEPSMAWQLAPTFSLGLGLSVRATTLEMSGGTDTPFSDLMGALPEDDPLRNFGYDGTWGEALQGFVNSGGRDVQDYHVDFVADAENTAPHVFLKLGGAWQVNSKSSFGFWYRPMSSLADIKGMTTVDMSSDLGAFTQQLEEFMLLMGYEISYLDDPTSEFDFRIRDVRLPQQVGVSSSSAFGNVDVLHFAAIWTDWSQSFDGWEAHLTNPSNEQFAEFIGGDGSLTMDMDMQWQDTLSLSLGWEHLLGSHWVVRSGLAWSNNPLRGSWMAAATPFNEWHISTGISYQSHTSGVPDFFLSTVVAVPQKEEAGENLVLADLSGDQYSQWHGSLAFGLAWRW